MRHRRPAIDPSTEAGFPRGGFRCPTTRPALQSPWFSGGNRLQFFSEVLWCCKWFLICAGSGGAVALGSGARQAETASFDFTVHRGWLKQPPHSSLNESSLFSDASRTCPRAHDHRSRPNSNTERLFSLIRCQYPARVKRGPMPSTLYVYKESGSCEGADPRRSRCGSSVVCRVAVET